MEPGTLTWILVGFISALSALAFLFPLAMYVRNEAYSRDLKARIAELQEARNKRLRELAKMSTRPPLGVSAKKAA
ncbi:MAG: hypothetical protein AB7Q00_11430 [Phycisphaerales bacterium]|nr:MAG: hypothetical protein IPK69_01245 [Phycisphaerales bacterium]